jgi:hypothetical protein
LGAQGAVHLVRNVADLDRLGHRKTVQPIWV